MPLDTEVGLGPGDIVLDGNPTPPPPKGDRALPFLAHVYCDQTGGWIKMTLGIEVGLGRGHIVIGGDPAPPFPQKGAHPQFSAHLSIVAKWIDASG